MRLEHPTNLSNFAKLYVKDKIIYFSYSNPIAIRFLGGHMYVAENEWGLTTGKHINYAKKEADGRYITTQHEKILTIISNEMGK